MLFELKLRLLLSADALWENGFGVAFPELNGDEAFTEVAQTLDLIESLDAHTVIPGHGPGFNDVPAALARARKRLHSFVNDPARHLRYAAKVLIQFKLLEVQTIEFAALLAWARATEQVAHLHQANASHTPFDTWVDQLVTELVRSGAVTREQGTVRNMH